MVDDTSDFVIRNQVEIQPKPPDIGDPAQDEITYKIPKGFGARHILVILSFFGFVNLYALRVNLSVALVAMVNQTAVRTPDGKNDSGECPQNVQNKTDVTSQDGEFIWDTETQGIILGAFFYGYIVTQLPGGWLADKIGGKHILGCGLLLTAILTLLTPLAARYSVNLLIAFRVLQGMGEGVFYPAEFSLLGRWLAPLEVSKYGGFIYAGAMFGTVTVMPIAGVLCQSNFLGGWPSVFYIFGGLTCLWYILWIFLVYNEPNSHPWISAEERNYINRALLNSEEMRKKKLATPWKSILTSMPVWALVIGTTLPCLQFYSLLTCIPTYMEEILRFYINQNGFLSALPYLVCWVVSVFAGYSADWIRERHIMSTTAVRKLYTAISLLLPGGFLIGVGYVGCDQFMAVVLLTLSVGFGGFGFGGKEVNVLDIAPQFSGTIYGIVNMVSTVPGMIGPYVVGYMTNGQQTVAAWLKFFYITVAFNVAGCIFYLVFASGVRQSWDVVQNEQERAVLLQKEDGVD